MDIPDGLEKKAGPVPVWVWGVGLGVFVVGIMWYRHNAGGTATATDYSGTDSTLDPGAIDNAGLYSGNNNNAANATYATRSMQKQVRTNPAWLRAAVQYETGKGRNALRVLRALSAYLASRPLSEWQDNVVSDVLTNVGLPPKPPAKVSVRKKDHSVTSNDGAVQTPPTKPSHGHGGADVMSQSRPDMTITPRVGAVSVAPHTLLDAVGGDTVASISQRAYGSSSPFHQEMVRRANSIGMTDEFVAGQKVTVPYV